MAAHPGKIFMEADIEAGLQKNSGGPEQSRLIMSDAHIRCAWMGKMDQQRVKRRGTNVTLDPQLVEEARALGVSVSRACEQGLAAQVKAERERRWLEENRAGFESWNRYIAEHGLPLAKYRTF